MRRTVALVALALILGCGGDEASDEPAGDGAVGGQAGAGAAGSGGSAGHAGSPQGGQAGAGGAGAGGAGAAGTAGQGGAGAAGTAGQGGAGMAGQGGAGTAGQGGAGMAGQGGAGTAGQGGAGMAGQGGAGGADAAWQATLDSAKAWMAAHPDVPGMTIAVVVDGKLRFAEGLGKRRLSAPEPVTVDTRFGWYSVSKMMTAAAALRLVEQGKLDLDVRVKDVVPELVVSNGEDTSAMTLRMLLDHTSGLATTITFPAKVCDMTLGQTWATVHPALLSPPGRVFVYNNFAGYSLASLVIERAGGAPFGALVEDLVFGPAGMTTATYDPAEFLAADHSTGTTKVGTKLVETDTSAWVKPCPVELGPGGMVATASDVAKMMAIHLQGGSPLLSAASEAALRDQVDTLATPDGSARYGLGVYRRMHHGTEVFSAWAFGDHRGEVVMAPSLSWGIVVGINADYAYPGSLAWEALDTFFPELPDQNPDYTTQPDSWSRYEGTYDDPVALGTVDVKVVGGKLVATRKTGAPWTLTQVSGDLFEYLRDNGERLKVQFVVPKGCARAAWLATSVMPETPTWPQSPLSVAYRSPVECLGALACTGNVTWPDAAAPSLDVSIRYYQPPTALGGVDNAPKQGVTVDVCEGDCSAPLDTGITDANGWVSLTLPTPGKGFGGYLRMTGDGLVPIRQEFLPPLAALDNPWLSPKHHKAALTPDSIVKLGALAKLVPDPSKGIVIATTLDCAGAFTDKLDVTINGRLPQFRGGEDSVFFDVEPGPMEVRASLTLTGKTAAHFQSAVGAGQVTALGLSPTPLP